MTSAEPNQALAHFGLLHTFHEKGMYEEALAELTKVFSLVGHPETEEAVARGYAEAGYRGAMSLAAETLADLFNTTYPAAPCDIAMLFMHAGEKDQTLEWLEKGFDTRDPTMPYIGVSPWSDPLRADPRFQDLLRRMNLPQAQQGR